MIDLKNAAGRESSKRTHAIEDARVVDNLTKGDAAQSRKIPEWLKKLSMWVVRNGVRYALVWVWEHRELIWSSLLGIIS